MKKILLPLLVILLFISAFIRPSKPEPGIVGTIDPAEGAKKVWAFMGTDSVSVLPASGKFSLTVRPGNWNILVETIEPYKNARVDNVMVMESSPTDVGVIKLAQK